MHVWLLFTWMAIGSAAAGDVSLPVNVGASFSAIFSDMVACKAAGKFYEDRIKGETVPSSVTMSVIWNCVSSGSVKQTTPSYQDVKPWPFK